MGNQTQAPVAPAFSNRKFGRYSDLVEALQVSRQTIYRWVKLDPTFPQPLKRGNTVLFDMAAVEAWLNGEGVK
ncbi:helix-turn-helix transcriptional regulator [Denitrificimonas caeni]|uniref:helix-turn-helix transcriptional regulator n=1 Tax=Denitrificimonas caeni TaxID=521720 RepID=UPI003B3A3BE3